MNEFGQSLEKFERPEIKDLSSQLEEADKLFWSLFDDDYEGPVKSAEELEEVYMPVEDEEKSNLKDHPVPIADDLQFEKLPQSRNLKDLQLPMEKQVVADTDKPEPNDEPEKKSPIQNKIDGLQREAEVRGELEKKYPAEEGYEIVSEVYLRDEDGNIVKDPETGQARRIDFVVVKDGKVVDSIEVTSKTADKTEQIAKEERIRDNGGNYIRDNNGNLIRIPDNVQTRVERRD